jgi:hypothetical protein
MVIAHQYGVRTPAAKTPAGRAKRIALGSEIGHAAKGSGALLSSMTPSQKSRNEQLCLINGRSHYATVRSEVDW